MDEYDMAHVRKIKTYKIYIHVVKIVRFKNSTNYLSSVKSSYHMYLRLCLNGNWSKTCTDIKLCSYGKYLQN